MLEPDPIRDIGQAVRPRHVGFNASHVNVLDAVEYFTESTIEAVLSEIWTSMDYTQVSSNDSNTDITGTELESLTDGSNADLLHTHDASTLTVDAEDVDVDTTNFDQLLSATDTDVQTALNTLDEIFQQSRTLNGDLTVDNLITSGNVDGVDVSTLKTDVDEFPDELKNLVTSEIQQLENIGTESISATEWGYVASMQDVSSGASPTFSANNFSDGGGNAIITTTQESNFEDAHTHISNNGTDHGYINQDVQSSATPEFVGIDLSTTRTSNSAAVRYDQVTSMLGGLDWQDSVLDITTEGSATQTTGNRYIASADGTTWTENNIYEWNGSSWTETVVNEGFTCWVEDVDTNYTYNGSAWVEFGSTVSHNNTTGLQGGTTSQYYHLTSSDYNALSDVNAQLTALHTDGTPTFVGLELSGTLDMNGGAIIDSSGRLNLNDDVDIGSIYLGASENIILNGGAISDSSGTLTLNDAVDISGALTATSYGGITEANLVDKTAAETITNTWDFNSTFPQLRLTDDSLTDFVTIGMSGDNFVIKRNDDTGDYLFRNSSNVDQLIIHMDTGNVDINGNLDMGGSLSLVDNSYLNIGTDNDFRITHDGSNGYVSINTGDLLFQNGDVIIDSDTAADMFMISRDGGTTQGMKMYVDDSAGYIWSVQDEDSAGYPNLALIAGNQSNQTPKIKFGISTNETYNNYKLVAEIDTDGLKFVNQSTGGNPVLYSSSSAQVLDFDGNLRIDGWIRLGANGIGNNVEALTFDTSSNASFSGDIYIANNKLNGNSGYSDYNYLTFNGLTDANAVELCGVADVAIIIDSNNSGASGSQHFTVELGTPGSTSTLLDVDDYGNLDIKGNFQVDGGIMTVVRSSDDGRYGYIEFEDYNNNRGGYMGYGDSDGSSIDLVLDAASRFDIIKSTSPGTSPLLKVETVASNAGAGFLLKGEDAGGNWLFWSNGSHGNLQLMNNATYDDSKTVMQFDDATYEVDFSGDVEVPNDKTYKFGSDAYIQYESATDSINFCFN